MIKTLKIKKKWIKLLQKNQFLTRKKYLHIKTLKLKLVGPELHKLGTICTLSHENPSCGLRERLRQTVFLENAISVNNMSLRTTPLSHFIQNKLYLQYIFIILL